MKTVLERISMALGGIIVFILVALLVAFIFTAPAWYIWNHIVAVKFGLPLFSFWDAFFTIMMIRLVMPPPSSTKETK